MSENQKEGPSAADKGSDKASWVSDESVSECSAKDCGVSFGFFTRKHHCRGCGRIFCYAHSSQRAPVAQPVLPPGSSDAKEPDYTVCGECYAAGARTVRRDPAFFNRQTTAEDAAYGYDLTGKVAVVTGGNSGVGFEAARALALQGASVLIGARNAVKGEQAAQDIITGTGNKKVAFSKLDLGNSASVKQFASAFLENKSFTAAEMKEPVIDMLILNAGIHNPPVPRNEETGLDQTFAVNHLGHFALTKLLMPALERSKEDTRIVVVSSHSHYSATVDAEKLKQLQADPAAPALSGFQAYNYSKLANVLFAKELQRRYGPDTKHKWDAFALHPGTMIATDIARETTGGNFFMSVMSPFTKSIPQGAATTVRCAVDSTLKGKGGDYFDDCQQKDPSDASKDEKAAAGLWSWSEELFDKYYGKKE